MIIFQDIGVSMAYNLNFHQTFKPEKNHISNLLTINTLTATKENLSHQFGIPTGKSSGKVEVSLLYAQAAGLLSYHKKHENLIIKRSIIGTIVYENDSYLEHELTQLLFHYLFCSKNSKLQLWELLFTKYHKGIKEIDVSDFTNYSQKTFNVEKIRLAPLWGTYISEDPLIDVGVLKPLDKGSYKYSKVSIIEHYVNWYSFFLYHFMSELDSHRKEFTIEELLYHGFHNIFSWNSGELRTVLELVESQEKLSLNKQFKNYHIYLNQALPLLIDGLEYI